MAVSSVRRAMIRFTILRPPMIATASPIAGTRPYLMKMKSTNPTEMRNVKMDLGFIPLELVSDFIRLVVILHPTINRRNSYFLGIGSFILHFLSIRALLSMKLYKFVDTFDGAKPDS